MAVNPDKAAAKRTRNDRRYYFCSLECAATFDDGDLKKPQAEALSGQCGPPASMTSRFDPNTTDAK
jgi:YHS domain-containing protein